MPPPTTLRLFESYCAGFLLDSYPITDIGTWYSSIPVLDADGAVMRSDGKAVTETTDIDIAAVANDGRNAVELFAECKLRGSPVGVGALEELERKVRNVHGKRNYRIMLISGSGFSDDLKEMSGRPDLMLVDLDVLFGRREPPPLRRGRRLDLRFSRASGAASTTMRIFSQEPIPWHPPQVSRPLPMAHCLIWHRDSQYGVFAPSMRQPSQFIMSGVISTLFISDHFLAISRRSPSSSFFVAM